MKILFILLILISFDLLASQSDEFYVMVGEARPIKKAGSVSSIIGAQNLSTKVIKGQLFVIGKRAGKSTIQFSHGGSILISIFSSALGPAKKALEEVLAEEKDVGMSFTQNKILVHGKSVSLELWLALAEVQRSFPEQVVLDLQGHPDTLERVRGKIIDALKVRGINSAAVELEGQRIKVYSLEPIATKSKKSDQRSFLENFARAWGADFVEGAGRIELRPMIEVSISIAEVKRSKMSRLGLSLPKAYSATVIPSADLGSFVTQYQGMDIRLNAQQEENFGKIIASPKLLCRSGESAQFVAGGEIPIKIMNWKTSDVTWKKYGVILNVSPKADYQKAISTRLTTEVSLIDEAHKVDGVPGFLTNRIETHFDIRGEKTIALSGLIKSELGRGQESTPLLSSIPILGELFKSRDYKDNSSELIVFVTPRVISPEEGSGFDPNKNKFWSVDE